VSWTTASDIKEQLQRTWDRGRILAARFGGPAVFPLSVRLNGPDTKALSERFQEVREWIAALERGAKAQQGFGYEIEWTEINHRQLGRNRIPKSVAIQTEEDALRMIGKRREADRFTTITDTTTKAFPELSQWLAKNPLRVLENADDWDSLLAVLGWFRDHPRCGLYLRQLDIPGVDTKFIETRKGFLAELLDCVLPAEAVDGKAVGIRGFEARYGLLAKPPLIRFRLLDSRQFIQGLSDITTTTAELARLAPSVSRVFITENETNGIAFPDVPDSMVIFGLGYGLDLLREVDWLHTKSIQYWGDIDTHGFAILDRLRVTFPHARSFLMDRATLLAHRALWVRESEPNRTPLAHLTDSEAALFEELRADRLGPSVRLEQERIQHGWLRRALD
jgi:hypothetical protein